MLTSGLAAGLAYILLTYPVDSVKSNIQAGMKLRDAVKNKL